MKKWILTLLFLMFPAAVFAAGTSVKVADDCWQCGVLEGVYTYTMSFAYRMFDRLTPIVLAVATMAFAFWFLWYFWNNIILKGGDGTENFIKEIVGKLVAFVFVIGLLELGPAKILHYSVEPIISAGSGFARWILEEVRADDNVLGGKAGEGTDCSSIQLSAGKFAAWNGKENLDEETLRNLICITRDYSHTTTLGIKIGFRIMHEGGLGLIEKIAAEKVVDIVGIVPTGATKVIGVVGRIVLALGGLVNLVVFIFGAGIMAAFFYITFTYMAAVFDIVIRLAMVATMLPIAIGAWLFKPTREKLSGALFFDVVKCSFRLMFLGVAMCLTTYLLNELLTSDFSLAGQPQTMKTLWDQVGGERSIILQLGRDAIAWTGAANISLLATFVQNTGMISAILFVTMVSWLLIKESLKLADSFSGAIASGIGGEDMMKGLQSLTRTAISSMASVSKGAVNYARQSGAENSIGREAALARVKKMAGNGGETKYDELDDIAKKVKAGELLSRDEIRKLMEDEARDLSVESESIDPFGGDRIKRWLVNKSAKKLDKKVSKFEEIDDADLDMFGLKEVQRYNKRRRKMKRK